MKLRSSIKSVSNQVCFHSCGISIILLVSELDLESIDPALQAIRPVISCVACSRRSDSGARAKNKASERAGERAGKKRGETGGDSLPSFFSRSFARSFARFIFRSRHYLNAWNRLSVVSKAGVHVHVCMRISSPSCSSITTTEYAKIRILLNRSCAANKLSIPTDLALF